MLEGNHGVKACELFLQGYNCAQSLLLAFQDVTGLSPELSLRLASSFGGGIGRLREVCGAFSASEMVLGIVTGYTSPDNPEEKTAHYARVRELASRFRAGCGALTCRELLGSLADDSSPVATKRDETFYKTRPCASILQKAGEILDQYLAELNAGDLNLSSSTEENRREG